MDVDRSSWASTLIKNNDENKTYILVKLSESFSNAIQEYHNNLNNNINEQNCSSPSPTIRFHGTRGAVKFPNGKSYDFSLEASDNPVECIRQCRTRWESVGKIACCLHVKGKDDVYQSTRTKMEAAEQAKRKNRTKLLDVKGKDDVYQKPRSKIETPDQVKRRNRAKLLDVESDTNITKSNNVSHYNHPPTTTTSNNSVNNIISNNTSSHSIINTSSCSSTNNITNSHSSSIIINNSKSTTTHKNTSSATTNNTKNTKITNINSSNSNNNNNVDVPMSIANNINDNNPVITSKYPQITDIQQLKKYKADFDKDFREYQKLHDYLHEIENRFKALRELLKKSIEGSSEWESAKDKIFSEYEKHKGDSNFHRARNKYKQLHQKLAHIKKMILQFKSKRKANNINTNGKHNDNNGKKKKSTSSNTKFKK